MSVIQVKCRGPGSIPLTGEKELGLNSMKRYLCRAAIAGVAGIFLLLSFVSCGRAGYQYNNLISEEDMAEFSELMASAGIPDRDAEAVLEYVGIYSGGAFSKKALVNGWQQTTKSYQKIYDYTNAINQYTQQEFEDINCRQAAFMLYHSFFQAQETESSGERQEARELPEYLKEEAYKYDILFRRIQMEGTVEDTVLHAWQGNGAVFGGGSVHLVSLWGVEDESVFNYHAGIMFEEDEGVLFFEKTDPILPFQLSRFASVDEMKAYLLGREGISEQYAVLVDDSSV